MKIERPDDMNSDGLQSTILTMAGVLEGDTSTTKVVDRRDKVHSFVVEDSSLTDDVRQGETR